MSEATAKIATVERAAEGRLLSWSFCGLLATQFLGAMNDNMFRLLAIGIGTEMVAREQSSTVVAAGLACFTLPYLLLAAVAGYLADRFSKRRVIVMCKVAEIVLMMLAVAAIYSQNLYALFFVLALTGAQAALFGPSKLGSIPEMLQPQKISAANGVVGLTTVVATVAGVVAGNELYAATSPRGLTNTWICAVVLIGTAVVGTLCSFVIRPLPVANPALKFPTNVFAQTWRDLRALAASRAMLRVALGIGFFWSLGALAQSNILEFTKEGGLFQQHSSPLLAALVVGVGLGSVLAGIWSAGRVELGIIPLGAAGVAISSILLFTVEGSLAAGDASWSPSYLLAAFYLFLLGISAGLFDVPLAAYMQHRSPPQQCGAILAACNFLTFAGMLLSAGLYFLLRAPLGGNTEPLFSAREVFLLAGIFTIPVFLYSVFLLPQASLRFFVWIASKTAYRVRVYGHENLPEQGGALLISNHVTWLDAVFLLMASSRPIRMLAHADYISGWPIRWLARLWGVIPITPGSKTVRNSLEQARQALKQGELVCIFPEGELTQTGQVQAFKPGLLSLAEGTNVPVIPVFLDELWGSIFSRAGGKYFWKWPRRWPYPVSIHFGRPIEKPDDVQLARQAVEELGVSAVQLRYQRQMVLPRMFLRMCKRTFFKAKLADSTGVNLTGGKLLIGSLALRRALHLKLLAPEERYVGLLLPPSVGSVVTNIALPLSGRIGVNLNYTLSSEAINSCIRQCGIRRVLTSRKVMEKLNLDINAELVYLDEFKSQVSKWDKFVAMFQAALPTVVLERWLGLMDLRPDDPITVIFTSGSTGEPKGVVLSQRNVGSNIEAMDQLVNLRPDDVAIGVLPFFHSYGYTATLWTVLAFDTMGVYHFSPLDATQVAKLCKKFKGTLLMVTPTFLRNYMRRCQREDLETLEVIFASAEKLPKELSDAFEAKFGVRPQEAYGATELSPLVAVNIPPARASDPTQKTAKEGSVGKPIPGVMAKVVDPDTGRTLPVDTPGMLLIKGPNVMQGYLHRPDLTEKVICDDWYVTGDIAKLDSDGFIFITGRQSRFSKIGGEMVPHIKIEETLQRILSGDEEELKAVVTAVPDSRRGERLVVLHKPIEKTPQQICKELQAAGLPNIWIPSADSFCEVPEIPVLGTGKLDLKGLKDLALAKFAEEPEPVQQN